MTGAKKIDKPCERCGVLMVNVVPARRYCMECTKKRRNEYQREHQKKYREYQRQYKRKKKTSGELSTTPIINPNKKYCEGCVYWGCRHYVGNSCCNYIFVNGHSRGCPPGKDCTEKVVGKRKYAMDFVTDCGVRG
jgi:hypothetical protein